MSIVKHRTEKEKGQSQSGAQLVKVHKKVQHHSRDKSGIKSGIIKL